MSEQKKCIIQVAILFFFLRRVLGQINNKGRAATTYNLVALTLFFEKKINTMSDLKIK